MAVEEMIKEVFTRCLKDQGSRIDFYNVGLSDEHVPVLKKLLDEHSSITEVYLGSNNLRNGVAILANCQHVKKLYLGNNNVNNKGAIALAASPIKILDFTANPLTDLSANALLNRSCENSLVCVNSCKNISDALQQAIQEKNERNRLVSERQSSKRSWWDAITGLCFWGNSQASAEAKRSGYKMELRK